MPLLSKLLSKQSVRNSPPIGEVATAYRKNLNNLTLLKGKETNKLSYHDQNL